MAGSVLLAGAGAGAAGRRGAALRVWAWASSDANAKHTATTSAASRLLVERGVVEVGILSNRAALTLEEREELHAGPRAGLK